MNYKQSLHNVEVMPICAFHLWNYWMDFDEIWYWGVYTSDCYV